MPVTITVDLREGETLQAKLRAAGLLPPAPEFRVVDRIEPYREPPVETQTFGPLPAAGPDEPASETAAAPKRRGRPKGTTATVMAERAAAEATPASPPGGYVVRRYGGQTDSEHLTAKSAMARLVELVGAAGDLQALDELMDANGDLVEALRTDDAEALQKVVDDTRATLTPPEEPAPAPEPEPQPVAAPAPAGPVWPFNQANETITVITPDEKGARDAVWAIACGQPPKFGGMVAMALLERHGVSKLSEIPSGDDKRWALIAVDGAGVLGLKVAGMTAPAAGGLM